MRMIFYLNASQCRDPEPNPRDPIPTTVELLPELWPAPKRQEL